MGRWDYSTRDDYEFFFSWFEIHTTSTPSTAETHTDGGAVIRKPRSTWLQNTPATSVIFMFYFMIVLLKYTFAYADRQTMNRTKHTWTRTDLFSIVTEISCWILHFTIYVKHVGF